jgi:hypothetical protein
LLCSEADKLEENEGVAAEAMGDFAGDGTNTMQSVDEKTNAVCVINSAGTIQMANKVTLSILGSNSASCPFF